jgi:PAS domain S-box-containing protein
VGPILLGVALIVVCVIGFTFYEEWQRLQHATSESAKATEVRRVTDIFLSAMKDAESGQRGFLLTGEEQYLTPYDAALRAIPDLLRTFAAVTKELPDQSVRVERLTRLTQEKLAELRQTIEVRSTRGQQAALEIVTLDSGRKTMDAIREICVEISASQAERLAVQNAERAARAKRVWWIVGSGSLVLFAIILVAGLVIRTANTRQAQLLAEIERSHGMLMTTFFSIGDAVITTDAKGNVTFLNPVAEALTGWSGTDAMGKALPLVFHIVNEHTRAILDSPVDKVLLEGRTVGLANHTILLAKDGREIPIDDSGAPIRDGSGELLGVVLVFRDITERKRAEDSLASSNAKIRDVLESITDGFLALDQSWNFEYANAAAEKILGAPKEQIVGKTIWQHFPKLMGSVVEANLRRVAAERTPTHFDSFYPPLDAWFEFHAYPSNESGIAVYLNDISERKRSEEAVKRSEQALRDSEARFRTAVLTMSDLVWTNSADGRMLGEQPGWSGFTGQRFEEYQGYGWAKAIHPDDAQPTIDEWNQTVVLQKQFSFEHRVRRYDGVYRLFLIRAVPVRNEDGTIREWVGVHTDITDRRAAEAEITNTNTLLRRSNADLEQFAYAASHDLQEPLRMVSIYSQMLKMKYEGKIDAEADTFIQFAVDGARQMDHLLRDLLAYSQATSDALEAASEAAANISLEKALVNLNAAIKASEARLTHGDLPKVGMAEIHLVQLFQNLVGNAIKYRGTSNPFIHVDCRKDTVEWIFSVQDNGMGIEEQYLKQVFGVFKRLHGKQYPGTGIGLAICQRIVDRYGGRIWVESAPGDGSTFFFTVPTERAHQ